MAPPPPVMFRGDPAHTGAAAGTLFDGQGGVRWRVRTDGAVRSSPAVAPRGATWEAVTPPPPWPAGS